MSNTAQKAAAGKCSKPAGEYCRLHNPHPITASTTVEQVFAKVFPNQDKASQVKAPSQHPAWKDAYRNFQETTRLLTEQEEIAHIQHRDLIYAVNDDPEFENITNKKALKEAYIEQGRSGEYHDDIVELHERQMNEYYKQLIESEFAISQDKAIAQRAALSRYADEFVGYPSISSDDYYGLGITRKQFFQRATEPEFARKLQNIEKAYIKAGRGGKEATKTELNQLANNRKKYAKSEDWDDVDNVATYDSSLRYSVYRLMKDSIES